MAFDVQHGSCIDVWADIPLEAMVVHVTRHPNRKRSWWKRLLRLR